MVRKSLLDFIGGINESKKMFAAEDYNTWLRIFQLTDQFLYLPLKLGFYLTYSQSISKKDMSEAYEVSINEFTDILNVRQLKIIESNSSYMSGRYFYSKKGYGVAFAKLLKSIYGGKIPIVMCSILFLIIIIFKQIRYLIFFRKRLF